MAKLTNLYDAVKQELALARTKIKELTAENRKKEATSEDLREEQKKLAGIFEEIRLENTGEESLFY